MGQVIPFRPNKQPDPNSITNEVSEHLVTILAQYDCALQPEDVKDLALMIESVRSFVCRKHHQQHPLQHVADTVFKHTQTNDSNIEIDFDYQRVYSL